MPAQAQPDNADWVAATRPQLLQRGTYVREDLLAPQPVQQLKAAFAAGDVMCEFDARGAAVVEVRGERNKTEGGDLLADVADMCRDSEELVRDEDTGAEPGPRRPGDVAPIRTSSSTPMSTRSVRMSARSLTLASV